MSKQQRHRIKLAERRQIADLALALKRRFVDWQAENGRIRTVRRSGKREVVDALTIFLASAFPGVGRRAHLVAAPSVGISDDGVHIDFNECARRVVKEIRANV